MCLVRVALAVVVVGCSGADDETSPVVTPAGDCAAGEWLREDGTCVPAGLPPDMPCPPGEWPRDAECLAAGVPPDGCGQGFAHDGDHGCEPILPPESCPRGFMAVPGERSCREVAPCAAGTWGDIPIEPNTEHVDRSYVGLDSDGSALKPWRTVQAAVDAAAPGAIVAVAAGSYFEDVTVSNAPVRIWGRCPSLVEVVSTGAYVAALGVLSRGTGTEVRGIALGGVNIGFFLSGALGLLEHVWIRDNAGRGVAAQSDLGPTSITLRASLVEQNHDIGVFVSGSEGVVERSVVRATQPDAQGLGGRGLGIQPDPNTSTPSTVQLRGSLVESNHEMGVFIGGSEATLEATVVRRTQYDAGGLTGSGVHAQASTITQAPSMLELRASLVEQNHAYGVFVSGSEATVEATVVRETQTVGRGRFGRGVGAQPHFATGAPATLQLRTSLVERNHGVGVSVDSSEAIVEATIVRETQPDQLGSGRGVGVQSDPTTGARAKLQLNTSVIAQSHEAGVFVGGSDATVETSIVRDTQPNPQGDYGRGVDASADPMTGAPAMLRLRASLVERNHDVGVFVAGSEATLETSAVRDTQPDGQALGGRGINAQTYPRTGAPSTLALFGCAIESSHETGVIVIASIATIEACVVRDTLPNGEELFGSGVVVRLDAGPASATITRTRIDRSALAAVATWGAHVAVGGSRLSCQTFDLDYETLLGNPATLEDLGDNLCGCPEPTAACKAVSGNLDPPSPLEP